MEIRPSIMKFAADMEQRLRDNDNKIGWEDVRFGWLMNRLKFNSSTMEHFMNECDIYELGNIDRELFLNSCTDVANFAMMIDENFKQRGKYNE